MSTYTLAKVFLKEKIGLQSKKLIGSVLHHSQVLCDTFILDSIRGAQLVADLRAAIADLKQRFNT